jgi:3',5'-cyclic AMP phosphodiesterase CpdA
MALNFLHLSDLHLTDNVFSPAWGPTIHHDPDLLDSVSIYWKSIYKDVNYIVVSGDLSTDGNLQSFRNLEQFFLSHLTPPSGSWTGSAAVGLELGNYDKLFFVPGNHDRYWGRYLPWATQIKNFESVFGAQFQNSGRPRNSGWMNAGGIRVRVLGIDSMGAAGVSMARGKVHDEDLDWLREMYIQDKQNAEVCDLRVLILHHHVALPLNRQFKRTTRLKNTEETIEAMLRGDIDLVMFGHEHLSYIGEKTYAELIGDRKKRRNLEKNGYQLEKNLVTCMCGTTTGHDKKPNLAWHVTIDKKTGAHEYQLKFQELEGNKTKRTFQLRSGCNHDISLTRRSCYQAIRFGF